MLALLGSACTCEATSAPHAPDEPAASPRDFFPAHAGDRWRRDDGESLAVTAVTEDGLAVFFGSDRTAAERFRVGEDAVQLVAPSGQVLGPWLERPMEVGHSWRYAIGEAECEARYTTVEETADVAGLTFEHCVEVRRRCRYPEGKPFGEATTELREEIWCPYVGQVAESVRYEPPPAIEGVPSSRHWRVTAFRVAGAPAPPRPEAFDCDALLLLETDVQAACGPTFHAVERSDEEGCMLRYAGPTGELTVRARRLDPRAGTRDVEAMLRAEIPEATFEDREELRIATGPTRDGAEATGFGLAEEGHVVAVTSTGCPLDRAVRLAPLLRSLLRP